MKKINLTISLVIFTFVFSFSQFEFVDYTSMLLSDTTIKSISSIGVVDMNGDGLDDIIRLDNGNILRIEYQGKPDSMFNTLIFGPTSTSEEFSICISDTDNNGFNDILVGGKYNRLKLLKANNEGSNYTLKKLEYSNIFVQGMNFVDINNDGFIDVFACHDDGLSISYQNDSLGNFSFNHKLINTASTIPSDNSGNYGSIWTDYDNDGDIDLYISKCRAGVPYGLDGRRVNLLFQNDGNGNFTDVAESAGLRPLAQSWASDFADIDNDGDLDCFLINHHSESQIYANNGDGTFTNVTEFSGIQEELAPSFYGYQCNFEDFDNDGFVDLLYSGDLYKSYLFHNNGDFTFSVSSDHFPKERYSPINFVTGDLNNDGFIDVFGSENNTNRITDRVYINQLDGNNYLRILLKGQASNSNAIGSRLEIYGDWGVQIREIRSGESYGIMNSLAAHFGLGLSESVDSLIVKWPSGIVDKLCGISANQDLRLTEGNFTSLLTSKFSFKGSNLDIRFTNESEGLAKSWLWDFGDGNTSTEQNTNHKYAQKGFYSVTLTSRNDCEESISDSVHLVVLASNNDALVYPNPAQHKLYVSSRNHASEPTLVFDMTGKLVYNQIHKTVDYEIDVSNWASGLYLLKINKGKFVKFHKK